MPCISVIVPVYNVEEYLALCLSSVRNQSLRDLEIICVNDGSTDSSGDLLDLFSAVDARIRIVEKKNGGLSSARNIGIEAARGDYIMFVDSDDLLEENACESVVAAFEGSGADIVTFGAKCYPESYGNPWLVDCLSPRDVVYHSFDIDILFKEKSRPYVWRSAFAAPFIKESDLRFDETVAFGEDQIFHFAAYPLARITAFMADKLYNYRVFREGSLMSTRNQAALLKLCEHLEIVDRILADWQSHGRLERYANEMIRWVFEFVAFDIFAQDEPDRTILLDRLREIIEVRFSGIEWPSYEGEKTCALLLAIMRDTDTDKPARKVSKLTLNRYRFESQGMRACVSGMLSGASSSKLVGAFRRGIRRIFPTPASSMLRYVGELSVDIHENRRTTGAVVMLLAEYEAKKQSGTLCHTEKIEVG
ncbi:MAG: glycosyltransferase family 2 protein [Gordonibacter sp.]|uniref:glycosyltransferase family 2 protein n=1 Tax=Gordonibacter sp. TaxID=1968902 RepID=UPI002FC86582